MTRLPLFTALVPMRHTSQRVPGKNLRPLAGRPLFRHIIDTLIGSSYIGSVVVDTDSDVIAADIEGIYGKRVRLISRSPELRAPGTSMNRILLHDVELLGGDFFLQTHATNPLLRTSTVNRAIERFVACHAAGDCDTAFSVTRRHARIWDRATRPLNHDPHVLIQTQDLEPYFEENSCLYLFKAAVLTETGNRLGRRPAMFEIDPLEAIDIDEESDFLLAEAVHRFLQSRQSNVEREG